MTTFSTPQTSQHPSTGIDRLSAKRLVIAVDGPAAAGKGTLAINLAKRLGLGYLDTGALYRAVALAVIETGGDATTILQTRAPRFQKKLPRPLSVDAAADVLDSVGDDARTPWVAARDTAVVTLLYGCGLRISEALGLTGAESPEAGAP